MLFAQEPLKYCGTDEMSFELFQNNPDLQQTMIANREQLKYFTARYISENRANRNADSLYIIPVVFHVIHTYGAENISEEQLMSGLKVLNWNFRKQNPDTATIVPAFQSIAADCEIEFRLAHLDPSGNCTSGINRIASTLSGVGDHSVKNLIHWDPSKYLNIYVVRRIPNLAGHCLMPDQAAAKPEWDGIVIANDYVGDMGTASDLTSVVMAHEAGHYLNLFHIWGGNNVPNYFYLPVGQASNCTAGDDVDDTPQTIGWSTCNLTAASCGNTVDNVQNAMDYSYCNFMFTQGQRQRMRAALNSSVAGRSNLVTQQNLNATGVNLTALCSASLELSRRVVCVGDTVFFKDKSIATPDSWLWRFGDGITSTQQNPSHVFIAEGDYYVTLTATKGATTVTSDSFFIRVNSPASSNPYYVQNFETVTQFDATQLFSENDNPQLYFSLSEAGEGYNSLQSAVVRIPDTTAAYSGKIVLTSPSINLSGTTLTPFSFRYASSQKQLNNNDQLEVFISKDCGETWLSMGRRTGTNFRTVSTVQTDMNWFPNDSTQWKTYSFSVPASHSVSDFLFKIELINYKANAFYLDNINVNASAYNSVQKLELQEIEIVPNPASEYVQIIGLTDPMQCTVTDVNGKICTTFQTFISNQLIDVHQLPIGIYNLHLENESSFCNKRFVKY